MSKNPEFTPEFTPQEQQVITAIDRGDILGANLASLGQTRLTHAQNVELGENIQRSLATSRRKSKIKPKIYELALGNAGLAIKSTFDLASQAQLTETDLEDCLQNGLISLLKAARIYDPWFETKPTVDPNDASGFATIAVPYIQGGLKSSEPEFQSITLPRSMTDRVRRYRRVQDLKEQFGLPSDHMEISEIVAKEDGLKAKPEDMPTIAENLQLALNTRNVLSLEDPRLITIEAGSSGESIQIEVERGDFLPGQDEEAEGIFTRKHELKDQVLKALEVLTNREREVLEMRFGLKDGLSHTREEVGHHFKSTEERIRLIEAKALGKLRHPARSRSLREYL